MVGVAERALRGGGRLLEVTAIADRCDGYEFLSGSLRSLGARSAVPPPRPNPGLPVSNPPPPPPRTSPRASGLQGCEAGWNDGCGVILQECSTPANQNSSSHFPLYSPLPGAAEECCQCETRAAACQPVDLTVTASRCCPLQELRALRALRVSREEDGPTFGAPSGHLLLDRRIIRYKP